MAKAARAFADFRPYVGTTLIDRYTSPAKAPCIIGTQRLTYVDLATRTGMPAGKAARILSKVATAHKARSIRHLFRVSTPATVARAGFGVTSLLLLCRLFASERLDWETWTKLGDWRVKKAVTFTTYKRWSRR